MSRANNKTSSFFGFNKRFTSYFALLLIAPLIQVVAPSAASAVPANSVTISTVGASTWTVPSNVSTVTIAFYGAQGGNGGNDGYAGGTPSSTVAKITGTINVTPGATLKVGIGGGGSGGSGCVTNSGGGAGGNGNYSSLSLGNYSGSNGGNAGPSGCSGGGGGGGAGSVLNGAFGTIVVGGGGAGGGGDNCQRARNAGDNITSGGAGGTSGAAAWNATGDGGGGGGNGGGLVGGAGGGYSPYNCGETLGYGGAAGTSTSNFSGLTGASLALGSYSPSASANAYLTISWVLAPLAPTSVTATPGNTNASVSWANAGNNGYTITGYTVTAFPGGQTCSTNNQSLTSCTVSGLTNGTSYTFTVVATNSQGSSVPSGASPAAIPTTACSVSSSTVSGYTTLTISGGYCYWTNTTGLTTLDVKAIGTGANYSGSALSVANAKTITTGGTVNISSTASIGYGIPYTLSYDGNGSTSGTVPVSYTTTAGFENHAASGNSGTLTKANYAFAGWNTLANGTGTAYAVAATVNVNANITLYAKWSQYALTYNSNLSNSGLPPVTLTSGGNITLGTGSLTRSGYYFAGWYTNAAGTGGTLYQAGGSYNLSANTTLYAYWSKYALTFNKGTSTSGTVPATIYGVGGITLPTNPGSLALSNYYFAGWYTNAAGTGGTLYAPGASYTITAATTLYASFAQYTLSYAAGTAIGGTVPTSSSGVGIVSTASTTTLAITGSTFSGWNTKSDGTGSFYAPGSNINLVANITLYPIFSQYTITYALGAATSGTVPSSQLGVGTVTLATNSGALARNNYYFSSWSKSPDGSGTPYGAGTSFTLTGNTTLYPSWGQYTITYHFGSATGGSALSTLGVGSVTLASNANGYTLGGQSISGWNTKSDGTGTPYALGASFNLVAAADLYAQWQTKSASVLSIANTILDFTLGTISGYTPQIVPITVTETTGAHSTSSFVVTVTGNNSCLLSGSANTTFDSSTAGETAATGFSITSSAIADCYVTITRPADSIYGVSSSTTKDFQFYPINQVTPLVVDNITTPTASVGTPITLDFLKPNVGDGSGAVSYAAYGNNCYVTVSSGSYSLNATTPTTCGVIVTRAAYQQWAIATSQTVASFSFTAVGQAGFNVVGTSTSVPFGTSITLSTTGGNGNGAVSYKAYNNSSAAGCSISGVTLTSTSIGTCSVAAYKSASGYYTGQNSNVASFTFTAIAQAPLIITPSGSSLNDVSPATITLNTTGGSGSGQVTYSATPSSNCTIITNSDGSATLSAAVTGSCVVTAWKSASGVYLGVLSNTVTYLFGSNSGSLSLVYSSTKAVADPAGVIGISLSVSGAFTPGGAITFSRYNNGNCHFTNVNTISGTATLFSLAGGSCDVQATQAASGPNLSQSTGLVTFTFTAPSQSSLKISYSSPNTSASVASSSTMNIVTTGGSGAGLYTYSVQSLSGATCSTVTPVDVTVTSSPSYASLTSSTPGTCAVTVVKSGDVNYSYATATASFLFTGQTQPTLGLTATPTTGQALSNVLITLTGGSGTGAITFAVSGAGCSLVGSNGGSNTTINVTASIASSCYVSASKAGDSTYTSATTYPGLVVNFTKATQSALTLVVDGNAPATTVTKTADLSYLLTTTGGAGTGAITFTTYGNGNCAITPISASQASLTSSFATATCSVIAYQSGDSTYSAASSSAVSLSFTAAAQFALSITGDASTAAVNANINLNVTGGSGTGAYSYKVNNSSDGGACVVTPSGATATVTSSTVGSCSVTVVHSGSGIYQYQVATSTLFTFGTAQSLFLSVTNVGTPPLPPSAIAGTPLLLSLSGVSGSGILTHYSGACTIVVDPITGAITANATSPTTCNITFTKAGDGTYFAATSNTITVAFAAAVQSTLTINATSVSSIAGGTIAVTTSGGSGSGAVKFTLNQTGTACTITSQDSGAGTASITRASSGNCSIQAVKSGSGVYGYAVSQTLNLVWGLITQTIPLTISNDPTTSAAGTAITLTTKGGQGAGAVTFTEIDYNPSCVIVGNQLSRSTFGNCLVRATKASDGTYSAINSQNINFTFYGSTAQTPISVTAANTSAALGQGITLSTVGGSSTGAVSYVITGGTGVGTITGNTLTASSAGTLTVVATKQGDSQYASVVSSVYTFTFTG